MTSAPKAQSPKQVFAKLTANGAMLSIGENGKLKARRVDGEQFTAQEQVLIRRFSRELRELVAPAAVAAQFPKALKYAATTLQAAGFEDMPRSLSSTYDNAADEFERGETGIARFFLLSLMKAAKVAADERAEDVARGPTQGALV